MSTFVRTSLFTARIAVSLVYCIAGASKLFDIYGFATIIKSYGIVPFSLIPWIAILLPIIEVTSGIGLLLRKSWGLLSITLITIVFIGILSYSIATGLSITDCGCFSINIIPTSHSDGSALYNALFKDCIIIIACAALYYGKYNYKTIA